MSEDLLAQALDACKEAARSGHAGRLGELLDRHPELKERINEPMFAFDSPAIVQAAGRGDRAVVDVLLRAGADINARSRWWAGSFGVLDSGDAEMAAYLIERGAAVDVHAAARLGMMKRLRELIGAAPALVHARGGDGQTPLHFAATVEVAEYLLGHGAVIDAGDVDHESTPAQYMVRSRGDVARFLIARGCKTDILMAAAAGDAELVRKHLDADPGCIRMCVNEEFFPKQNPRSGGTIYWTLGANKTAHRVAAEFGHAEVFKLLMDRSPDDVKLTNACAMADREAVKTLLAKHPSPAQMLAGPRRKHVSEAAEENNTDAVRLMLECGWPVAGDPGKTPLHWAAWHGNLEMCAAILPYNPPLEEADSEYHATPLGWAIHGSEHSWSCKTGDYAGTVEALLKAGAKPPAAAAGSDAVRAVLRRLTKAN